MQPERLAWTYSPGQIRARPTGSVAVFDRRDVALVAGGVRQGPPHWRAVVNDCPTGRESGFDALLGLLVGDPYADVDGSTTIATQVFHLLEPEAGVPQVGVDQVFVGRVGTSIVAKYGLPERHYRRGVGRSGDD